MAVGSLALVEREFDDAGRFAMATHVNRERDSVPRQFRGRSAPLRCSAARSARMSPTSPVPPPDRPPARWRPAGRSACLPESGQSGPAAGRLPGNQRVAADEIALVQLDRPGEARRVRVDGLGKLVAIERHPGFESQGVAGTQPARRDTVQLAGFQQRFPDLQRGSGSDDQLETSSPVYPVRLTTVSSRPSRRPIVR